MRNVLAVLEDDSDRLWSTFGAAVGLSESERSRLTLVKTREVHQFGIWCGPMGAGGMCVAPEDVDPTRRCGRLLARAAEFVPLDVPVTTLLLGPDTSRELRRLVETGAYDAVVASRPFLRRSRRLRRECCRDGVQVVTVEPRGGVDPAVVTQPVAIPALGPA